MKSDIYCLTDENNSLLFPAVQATILAKYSRSPLSARELLKEITEEKADAFQEKWVVNYGHNSVAELANVPICFEHVSIVASKYLESWPRAGYSEKSTRYQQFNRNSFIVPSGAPETMRNFAAKFYDAYERMLEPMTRICAKKMGLDPSNPEVLNSKTVKARAFDNVRYLLPAGTGTNLAAVINIRDARDMIKGLRGHSNPELRVIGEQTHEAVTEIAPTLVKHTEPEYFRLPVKSLGPLDQQLLDLNNPQAYVKLEEIPNHTPNEILRKMQQWVQVIHGMNWETFEKHMDGRSPHAEAPKIFRKLDLTFEIMMDYGAYRDLQRHRRCEQWAENLSINYGYLVPDDIKGSELEEDYHSTMQLIREYNDESVIHDVDLMQYMIPLGYLHRSHFKMDLAELYYIVELRTKPQGHISYRRIAYEMYELVQSMWPDLMKWCRAIKPDEIGAHH